MYSVSHGVDHAQLGHRLRKERISVASRRPVSRHVVVRTPVEEPAFAFQNHTIRPLRHQDAAIARVILMRYTVVQGLQHDLAIVLRDLNRD